MKFTLSWLKEHLETEASIAAIAEAMTMAGLEVEQLFASYELAPYVPGTDYVVTVLCRRGDRPLFLTCTTVKGNGVSYMIDAPIWHYRSPNPAEYVQALKELGFDPEAK